MGGRNRVHGAQRSGCWSAQRLAYGARVLLEKHGAKRGANIEGLGRKRGGRSAALARWSEKGCRVVGCASRGTGLVCAGDICKDPWARASPTRIRRRCLELGA